MTTHAALAVAAKPGSGSPSWLLAFVGIALVAIAVVALIRASQRGPAVAFWVPRRLRSSMNGFYERHGWPSPYDEHGTKRGR